MRARQVYYFSETERDANVFDDSVPICVNATGIEYFYAPFRQHDIRRDYGLVYVVNGEMYFKSENSESTLKKGEFSFGGAPTGKTVYYGSDCDFLHYYWLNFTGYAVEKFIESMHLSLNTKYYIGEKPAFEEGFQALFKEFSVRDDFSQKRIEAALTFLISAMAREVHNKTKPMLASVEYIHKNYNKEIGMEELAAMDNFSYSHFFVVFKEFTGMSPSDYIIRQRMNSACFYLAGTEYTISEIASIVGYADPCYFSRIFKKKIGLSPNQYRTYGKNKLT